MTVAYSLADISFYHGSRKSLEVARLELRAGEVVALVGPNGAGKTTLLHLMAFVESPASGAIQFFGARVTRQNMLTCRRRVGLLLQNPYLFHTTVLSNVMLGLKIRGISKQAGRSMALEALERVGLAGFEHRPAKLLSGGESQRVALARAIVLNPDVLLLDEPANHLDRQSVVRTREVVLDLNRSRGTTVVLATHNLVEAKTMAGTIAHLLQGQIIPGSPENLLSGRLSDSGSLFDTGRIAIRLPARVSDAKHLTVDPGKIALSRHRPASESPNTFRGRVVSLAAENGLATVSVEAGERFQINLPWTSDMLPDLCLGQEVWITLSQEGINRF